MKPDLMLYDANYQLVLVGEVKASKRQDAEWAAEWRRNLTVHGMLPDADFFLLVFPEQMYLWKSAPAGQQVPANFVGNTKDILKPYLGRLSDDTSRLSGSGLELAVSSWLNDITTRRTPEGFTADAVQLLEQSGLADRVREGSLVYGDD